MSIVACITCRKNTFLLIDSTIAVTAFGLLCCQDSYRNSSSQTIQEKRKSNQLFVNKRFTRNLKQWFLAAGIKEFLAVRTHHSP